jgi:hypothetical protein
MNVGIGAKIIQLFRPAGGDQQVANQNAAMHGAASNFHAQDKVVKDRQAADRARIVGGKVATRNVLDKAGVTKVAASKKR